MLLIFVISSYSCNKLLNKFRLWEALSTVSTSGGTAEAKTNLTPSVAFMQTMWGDGPTLNRLGKSFFHGRDVFKMM